MINEIQAWVMQQVQHNEIFAGLMGASVVAPLLYLARSLPRKIWSVLVDQFTVSVVVTNDDDTFEGIVGWLSTTPYAKKSRRNKLSSTHLNGQDVWNVAPGFGRHYVWYERHLVLVDRENNSEAHTFRSKETVTLTTIGRSQKFIRSLIQKAEQLRTRPTSGFSANIWNDWWESIGHKPERSLESVILPDGQKERILKDIEIFQTKQKWYTNMGVPYRRGYMFSGAPGTGKSSIIAALACKLGMSVYLINLGMVSSDNALISAFSRVPSNAILVIEDVDAFGASKKRKVPKPKRDRAADGDDEADVAQTRGVSLSGLLNAIDGIVASEGRILIMTTNHPDKLDPALIRPGRIDLHEQFNLFGQREIGKMYQRFYGEEIPCIKTVPISAAELQNLMMIHTSEALIPILNNGHGGKNVHGRIKKARRGKIDRAQTKQMATQRN